MVVDLEVFDDQWGLGLSSRCHTDVRSRGLAIWSSPAVTMKRTDDEYSDDDDRRSEPPPQSLGNGSESDEPECHETEVRFVLGSEP